MKGKAIFQGEYQFEITDERAITGLMDERNELEDGLRYALGDEIMNTYGIEVLGFEDITIDDYGDFAHDLLMCPECGTMYALSKEHRVIRTSGRCSDCYSKLDLVDYIIAYENGGMTNEEIDVFFQLLLDTGVIAHLQGRYERTMLELIEFGRVVVK